MIDGISDTSGVRQSCAWDRYSVVVAAAVTIVCVGSAVSPIAYGWRALFSAGPFTAGGPLVPPTIGLIVWVPLAFAYWRISRSCLGFTPSGIVGLSSKREIPYGEIDRWAIQNRTLYLWPAAQARTAAEPTGDQRSFFSGLVAGALRLHPGAPRDANWAAINPSQVGAISELLTTRVGTMATMPTKATWWQVWVINPKPWRTE
ncbi:MAG: hypothetical protein FWD63_07295 [Propionibacteriaceae bacterium]|nr:hypothetical protein [Propionibacteriaceae bacterium]